MFIRVDHSGFPAWLEDDDELAGEEQVINRGRRVQAAVVPRMGCGKLESACPRFKDAASRCRCGGTSDDPFYCVCYDLRSSWREDAEHAAWRRGWAVEDSVK